MPWNEYAPEDNEQHVDGDTCGRCRKKLGPGHRVVTALIVESTGPNPANLKERGSHLFADEYELVHIDCKDPLLKSRGQYR